MNKYTNLYHYFPGHIPIVVNIPHAGIFVPDKIIECFTPQAKPLPDTDWHVEQLYAFARQMGAHMLVATHSRYVVDLNRDSSGQLLYPGKFTTGLCPTTLFDGSLVYINKIEPDEVEIQERINSYWQPYHDKLQAIINKLQANGPVIVFDAHSIRSQVPNLFDGILPDLNIGTADGVSAHRDLTEKLFELSKQSPYTAICNGRFKGGYITRHYGNPTQNIHAIQLELAQHNYMEEGFPFTFHPDKAYKLQKTLRELFIIMQAWLG